MQDGFFQQKMLMSGAKNRYSALKNIFLTSTVLTGKKIETVVAVLHHNQRVRDGNNYYAKGPRSDEERNVIRN